MNPRTLSAWTICLALAVVSFSLPKNATGGRATESPIFPAKFATLYVDGANNLAGGIIHLHNDTEKELSISLVARDFISKTTNKGLNAKTVFFGPADSTGQPILKAKISAKETLAVRIDVSNLWEAGESEATLYNHGVEIGKLVALKYRPPFNVKLVSATPDKPELSFYDKKRQQITLRNEDNMTYTVHWSIEVDGTIGQNPDQKAGGSSSVTLAPNSSSSFHVVPAPEWFSAAGLFRTETLDGTITLTLQPPGSTADPGWPVKVIPFKARLDWVPELTRELIGYVIILILLAGGGGCSLVLSHWVPNQLARAKLKDRLGQLAERIRELSSRIESRLQVSLRVARHRLVAELYTRQSISAELPSVFATVTQQSDSLEKLIEQVAEIDRMLRNLEQLALDGGPPSRLEAAERLLKNAKDLISRIDPPQADLQSAQKLAAEAKGALEKMDQKDEPFAQRLLDRLTQLHALRVQAGPVANPPPAGVDPKYDVFRVTLAKLFATADSLHRTAARDIPVTDYGPLDNCVTKIEFVRDYVALLDGLSAEMRAKLATGPDFHACITAHSADKLRAAKQILRQMQQRIFPTDIIEAIKNAQTPPRIRMEPATVRQFSPNNFSVDFPRPEFNTSAALKEVNCEWDYYHDGLTEFGWQVWHYFPVATKKNKAHTLKARFADSSGSAIVANGKPVDIQKDFEIIPETPPQFGDRNKAELVRLVVALFVALLGLLSGAHEQLLKLDLIPAGVAVFLLGFGADSIKNVLIPKVK